jgi:hypothetical protein
MYEVENKLLYAHKHSATVTKLALVRQFLKRNAFTQFHETSTVESLTLTHGRVSTSRKAICLFCSVKKGSTPSVFLPCPFNIWPLQQQQQPVPTSRRLPSAQARGADQQNLTNRPLAHRSETQSPPSISVVSANRRNCCSTIRTELSTFYLTTIGCHFQSVRLSLVTYLGVVYCV